MIKSRNKPFSQEMSMCNFSAIFSVTPISKTGFEVFIAHCCPPVEELIWLTGTKELSLNSFSRKNLQVCSSSKRCRRWVEMMGNLNLHNNADGMLPLSVHFRSFCVFLLKRFHVFDIFSFLTSTCFSKGEKDFPVTLPTQNYTKLCKRHTVHKQPS